MKKSTNSQLLRLLFFLAIFVIVFISLSFIGNSDDKSIYDDELVAYVNGEKVFDDINHGLWVEQRQGIDMSRENYIRRIVQRRLVELEASQVGLSASAEELNEAVESQRQAANTNEQTRSVIDMALKLNGMSEDEYWKSVRAVYEKMLIRAAYKEYIRKQYVAEFGGGLENSSNNDDFNSYYDKHVAELFDKNKVEIVK